ncbi:hypothetical protein [Methanococcoides seepicolus]|uniref:Uncharacterized protein n=1 Tax=Methanococcoides seepicolus TaxID=2828780 RepID=A0A9E4ZG76_9EURY|nr:hypothetical protein [Methanococcoides seepicolus]MCM1987486.1 hypothetical protein [Methanococcoides seepicolus]
MIQNILEVALNNNYNLSDIANLISNLTSNLSDILLNTSNKTLIVSQVDPNWFYSASAQSAATIVGLMGAFTTTKLINYKSFVNQLQKEIAEYKIKIDHLKKEIETKNTYIREYNYKMEIKLVNKFLGFIAFEINPDKPYSLDELYAMTQNNLDYLQFENIDKTILAEKYNEEYLSDVRNLHEFPDTAEPLVKKNEGNKYELKKHQTNLEVVVEKKAERSYYKSLLINKQHMLASKKEVMGLRDNLGSLFIFSLTGIFLPLFMMLCSNETMTQYRNITYIFIFGGWILIIGQLYSSVIGLFKDNN